MIISTISTENTIVADADISTSIANFGWNKTGDISAMDSILNTSMVAYHTNDERIELELSDECEAFKKGAIRSEVASVSCAYDPVIFCDILDDNIALSKFSTAVGSTTDSPKILIVRFIYETVPKILTVNILAQVKSSYMRLLAHHMMKIQKELMPNYFKMSVGSTWRQQSVISRQQLS